MTGGCIYPVVKVSQYPLPRKMIKRLLRECKQILVLEEGYPVVEEMLKGYPGKDNIMGRLDGTLPRDGELNPDLVGKALCFNTKEGAPVPEIVAPRPPALCTGCSHRDVYKALNEVIATYGEGRVFSDIGCYTLGALPPFQSINSCVDMGASITMAKGACDAGLFPTVAGYRRLDFHPFRYDRFIGCCQRKNADHSNHLRQRIDFYDRRSGILGPGKNRIDLSGYRSRTRTHPGIAAGTQEP